MKKVLIISPHFPPVNAPDMHRVRQSLPYFEEFGWEPVVFAVVPDDVEGAKDDLLTESLPASVEVHHVQAFSTNWTRKFGLGNLGIRSYLQLRLAVDRYLRDNRVDLIYFTTTVFVSMALGPHWKRKFGVPFIIDLQDPWRNDYYLSRPRRERHGKFWFDYRLNRYLEERTIPQAAGIISVSSGYIDSVKERYPQIGSMPCLTLPFGALADDFTFADSLGNIRKNYSVIDVVYIGRGGDDMRLALEAMFIAFRNGLNRSPELFSRVRFSFIGTSYAPDGKGKETIAPLARTADVSEYVTEETDRLPYFQALKRLQEADLLFIPGSMDSTYTASKLYPYILAGKPILALFNEQSSVVDILHQTCAGEVVPFSGNDDSHAVANRALPVLTSLLNRLPFRPVTDWSAFEAYTARRMTQRQCEFFDSVKSER